MGSSQNLASLPSSTAAFLTLVAVVAVVCRAEGAVFEVPSDGLPTIQSALDFAGDGDEVRVAAGVYSGPGNRDLDFRGHAVRLVSASGPELTIIDCGGSPGDPHQGVVFDDNETPTASIEGFTVRNGYAPGFGSERRGGGIVCEAGASPTILDCWLVDNDAARGGGVFCGEFSSPQVRSCIFEGNHASLNGGAISAMDGAAPLIESCVFRSNSSEKHAGALGAIVEASVLVRDCYFAGNETASQGGALFVDRSQLTVQRSVLVGNTAAQGGGLLVWRDSQVEIRETTVSSNGANEGGGIHLLGGSTIHMDRGIVFHNCAGVGDELFAATASGRIRFRCSVLRLDGFEVDPVVLEFEDDPVTLDPQFCDLEDCTTSPSTGGDYTVDIDSPCTSENSSCGERIGALGIGCGGPSPVIDTSWGILKREWRSRTR